MGHIHHSAEPAWQPFNIVAVIEGIIHDHDRLDAFRRSARASLRETGLLPHNPIWNYLHWRRDLDPSRFDYYHPEFVRLFRREEQNLRAMQHHPLTTGVIGELPTISWPSTPVAQVPVVPPPQYPPLVGGASVPEPGTLTLALAALATGVALVAFRALRRFAQARTAGRSRVGSSLA